MTEAAFRRMIISSLKRLHGYFKPKKLALKSARVGRKINPKTNKMCFVAECCQCKTRYFEWENKLQVDHITTVVPTNGWGKTEDNLFLKYDWNQFIERLFIETGYQVLCASCHKGKSNGENIDRKTHREFEALSECF
jgi:hypothetical protein